MKFLPKEANHLNKQKKRQLMKKQLCTVRKPDIPTFNEHNFKHQLASILQWNFFFRDLSYWRSKVLRKSHVHLLRKKADNTILSFNIYWLYLFCFTFLVKDAYDYQGRSFLHIPQDVGVNLKSDEPPEKCFLPKKQIHTWTGHTKGVSAIRWFPRSAHLLLSCSMDCKIKVTFVPRCVYRSRIKVQLKLFIHTVDIEWTAKFRWFTYSVIYAF